MPNFDPQRIPPNQQMAAPGKWPVVGEKAPGASDAPWSVTVDGMVEHSRVWTLDGLRAMPQTELVADIHCVTRWSRLGMKFGGVPLPSLLEPCIVRAAARFISFAARSDRGHSTSLPLADALELGVLIALTAEGAALPTEHGGPVRCVTPGRYFYKSVKWLERIELLEEDRPGYWESEAGYHNRADPWREERYIAPNADPRVLRRSLEARDFRGRDFRSVELDGRDLSNLDARDALLRDCRLRNADLSGARFDRANLSNSHLEGARLHGASFRGADVEGADFRGADLRGADFTGASLFGATFCAEPEGGGPGAARIDQTTRIDPGAADALTPVQQAFVLARIAGSG